MFVLFDSCWDPLPRLGPQHPPIPGVYNSGWVQSPGAAALADANQYPRLKAYVQGVVAAFAKDGRILAWDVWNEPGTDNAGSYPKEELKEKDKTAKVTALLPQVFEWAREANPMQPLTSGVWAVDTSPDGASLGELQEIQLRESDVIEVLHPDGTPYRQAEVDLIRRLTGKK